MPEIVVVRRCAKHGETKTLRCKQCDRENPFPKSKDAKAHLKWVMQRLRDYYGEPVKEKKDGSH